RALAELFQCAGGQFDPELVQKFSELFSQDQNLLTERLARRWLRGLNRNGNPLPWEPTSPAAVSRVAEVESPEALFEKKLIDNMHDGVLFVDVHSMILLWNTGAERLTGVSSSAACGRTFLPSLLDMHNSHLGQIPDDECPVARAMETG